MRLNWVPTACDACEPEMIGEEFIHCRKILLDIWRDLDHFVPTPSPLFRVWDACVQICVPCVLMCFVLGVHFLVVHTSLMTHVITSSHSLLF